jgi:PAS domain S-box-containing protein
MHEAPKRDERIQQSDSSSLLQPNASVPMPDSDTGAQAREVNPDVFEGLVRSVPGVLYNFHAKASGEYTSTFVSAQAQEILGIPNKPFSTFFERFLERIPESHRPSFVQSVSAAVGEETNWEFETPFIRPDGRRIWLQCKSHPERKGTDLVFAGVLLEITERKEAEAALQEREARIHGLAESVPGVIFQFYARSDEEYGLHYVSPQAKSLLGLSPRPDGFFERFVDCVDGAYIASFEKSVEEAVREVKPWSFLLPFILPNGSTIWVEGYSTPEQRDSEVVFNGVLLDVTDRKETQQALDEERERLHTLFESLPTPAIRSWVDPDGAHVQAANKSARDVFGLDNRSGRDAIVEQEIVLPEDRDRARQINHIAIQEGTLETEVRRKTRYGVRDFQLQVASRNADDRPEVFGIYTDITKQKRGERQAQRRREKTEALYAATQGLLSATDLGTVADILVDLAMDTFDYPGVVVSFLEDDHLHPVQVSGTEAFRDLPFQPVAIDTAHPLATAFCTGSTACHHEMHAAPFSGTPFRDLGSAAFVPLGSHGVLVIAAFESRAIADEDVRLLEILGANVTAVLDRMNQQADLEISESTYRGIINQARDSIFVLTAEGEFVMANSSTALMLGTTVDELVGSSIADVLDRTQTDLAKTRERFASVLDGTPQRLEVWAKRADGSSFPKDIRLQPVTYFDQPAVLGVGRNMEEHKRRERELRTAKLDAERANEIKSAFLANMSHEIRTPLTSIIGFAEAIGDMTTTSADDEQQTAAAKSHADLDLTTLSYFAGLIEKSGQQLMETLNGVLNLSKLEANDFGLAPEPVDLVTFAVDAAETFQLRGEKLGLQVRTDLPDKRVNAYANPQGIQIVLRNLVSNAIKYTNAGGAVTIRAHEGKQPDTAVPCAVLEVEDTGIGMSAEFVEQAFEAFYQESRGQAREFEGTGLGLAVVEKAVKEMKGSVEIDSKKGEGTCVSIYLPQ